MDTLKKLEDWDNHFPKTESSILSHQMAALETAQRKLRKFCRTLPKCSDTLNCDTCEIINKIEDINDWLAILGDLQQEWDPDLEKIDPKFETDLLTSYFKLFF